MVRVLLGQAPQQPDDRFEQHTEDHRPLGEGDPVLDPFELCDIQARGRGGEPRVRGEVVGRVVGAEAAQRCEALGECRAVR
ncbi:hypothetical protein ABZ192_30735 [Streptomyces sp. NPDC006235]|uniref:hypothetical protein n=1 Tax=Streptomyces sp. NPDC006235 TaxID=3156736 RepID=UPI0033BBE2AD